MVNRGNSEYTYKKIVLLYKLLSVDKRAEIWSQKLKYCGVTPMEYQRIGENESELWFCPDCLRRELSLIEASFNSSCNNGLDPDDRCASIGPDYTKSNARSLLPKMEEIRSFVQERSQQSWVMAIGETWLNNTVDDGEVGLEGYRKDRRNQRGGGVLVYVPESFLSWILKWRV